MGPWIPAQGAVRLWPDDPMAAPVEGELVEVSPGGFRARHGSLALTSGQTVRFASTYGQGRARVAWARTLDGQVESGFSIVAREG